jgi:acylphosphatase
MMTNQQTHTFKAIVRGRVQGVGFRAFTRDCAKLHQVSGWVKNALNGDVEVYAQGDEISLTELLTALYQGPILSHIDHIDITWDTTEEAPSESFLILR